MPTVYLKSAELFRRLGRKYTEKEFEDLCFDFGIELDDVTSEWQKLAKQKTEKAADEAEASKEEEYGIDIPANRYDLLSLEGLCQALRIFICGDPPPTYTKHPHKYTMTVNYDRTKTVRPFVVSAVLRNLKLDQTAYESCLAVQDKMHQNICRNRSLVAIGTHDLDTLTPPFTYTADPPDEIKFKALFEEEETTAAELFNLYRSRDVCALKPYLHLIEDSPRWPVIRDSKGVVLSMPPIINGEHSKCHAEQRNMLIECTATDLTKANIVLNTIIAAFSSYCEEPFSVEGVKIIYEGEGAPEGYVTPNIEPVVFKTTQEYINRNLGTEFEADEIVKLLAKMCMPCTDVGDGNLEVRAPITRSDIIHPVDIVEDVAIAYGYNKLTKRLPENQTVGKEQPINMLTDAMRRNMAMCGFSEVLNWALVSKAENAFYNDKEQDRTDMHAVKLQNAKTQGFEVVRTNLLPCVLKTLSNNLGRQGLNLPIHIFETGDVCLLDGREYEGSRNERRVCLLVCTNKRGCFETIHGMLDRVMDINEFSFVSKKDIEGGADFSGKKYSIRESVNTVFLPNRRADVLVGNRDGKPTRCGIFGILSPDTCSAFSIPSTVLVSALELNLEVFLKNPPVL